jgi:hypothetical protein
MLPLLIWLAMCPFVARYDWDLLMSRKFFTGWTVVVFIWSWCAALLIWDKPVWQSRGPLVAAARGIFGDITGKRKVDVAESLSGTDIEVVEKVRRMARR